MSHLGQPGQIGTIVKSVRGRDTVNDRLNELEKVVRQLTVARSANYTTVGAGGVFKVDGALVASGDTTIGGNLIVNGTSVLDGALILANGATLTASGDIQSANYVAGVSGWKLDGTTGNLEINDATIRGGIIGDGALANPVAFAAANNAVNSATFTGTYASRVTATITVPTGYTRAVVNALAIAGTSAGGSPTLLGAFAQIDGSPGDTFVTTCQPGDSMTVTAGYATTLTGLSGSFTVEAFAACPTPTAGSNNAHISASAIFLR